MNSPTTAHFIRALGDEVRTRRQTKKLTQVGLATRANVHPNTISLVERAQIVPKIDALLALAAALDTSLSQLVKAAETRADLRQTPSASHKQQP
ncbi:MULTISPECIES: helix-turn-helix domain-containing protein [Burkholderia cepacia complex]|uniref:Transcriptional regulator n=1 Tax=Burkholderia cenocepacia TaxID=95486 RepID=A0AAD0NCV5_9BURK|nr:MULTISPECIES: helix-turn-helix transcriptional regulator [Burkholderia cepacia complex]AWG29441.1 transcriptional regulator [Burkholderia cenocepacia]MBR8155441.1 helix-turn-helix transcriptional regulator [Burkholderia cenocepacia]MBR8272976.1 helix-turn-helix transcriptional regulator [Burkholderia cenocepacia]MBR8412904.1 helix-turn-helix transcriptional regulator [Burkholderia cenocepacia]MCA8087686.1 helix-turn-helix domain-containing protein [Burkholderia cenocepacia]